MAKIGFIGIGAMGEPMAANLLKKGFSVTALKHRREEPAQRLQDQGALIVHRPIASPTRMSSSSACPARARWRRRSLAKAD